MADLNIPFGAEAVAWTVDIDGVTYRPFLVGTGGQLLVAVRAPAAIANGSVTVGVASTQVRASTPTRVYAAFVNDSDTTIYLALEDAAVLNAGIRLNAAGGSYEITQLNPWTGAVNAICSVAGKVLTYLEGTA